MGGLPVRVVDLAGKFQQKRKFVEVAERELIKFYQDVGQHLRNWVAPAPKVKKNQGKEPKQESSRGESARIPDQGLVWAREFSLPKENEGS